MSWVTVVWSMIASACLTLAAIYCLVWYRNRTAWAHLWFAATAVCTAGLAFFELRLMQAETLGDVLAARMWAHVPLFFWLVSITWFVRTYLGAGRLWLAWTICGLRAISLLVNLLLGQNPAFGNVASLQHVQFLGERVTVLGAAPNSMTPITQFATLLVVIFVADASVTAWRRGDRRRALMVGANLEFFLLASLGTAMAVLWAGVQAADYLQPLLPGAGGGDGLRVESRRASCIATRPRVAGQRSRVARERGAPEPGGRRRRFRHLDPRPRATRNLGEREVAGATLASPPPSRCSSTRSWNGCIPTIARVSSALRQPRSRTRRKADIRLNTGWSCQTARPGGSRHWDESSAVRPVSRS